MCVVQEQGAITYVYIHAGGSTLYPIPLYMSTGIARFIYHSLAMLEVVGGSCVHDAIAWNAVVSSTAT